MQKTTGQALSMDAIKTQYPDQWILIGNPKMDGTTVLSGIVIHHCKEKRDLLKGKHKLKDYATSTWAYTGQLRKKRKLWLGIHRKVNNE